MARTAIAGAVVPIGKALVHPEKSLFPLFPVWGLFSRGRWPGQGTSVRPWAVNFWGVRYWLGGRNYRICKEGKKPTCQATPGSCHALGWLHPDAPLLGDPNS